MKERRPWWATIGEILIGSTLGYKVQLIYGEPAQLSVDEFRKKFIGLLVKEKGFSRSIKKIQAAIGYREIIAAQFGTEAVYRYDPPLTMKIEVPD